MTLDLDTERCYYNNYNYHMISKLASGGTYMLLL